jgi:hypothetical protein
MTNSKDRRRLRRLLKSQGLSAPPPKSISTRPHQSAWKRLPWKRLPRWAWGLIVAASVLTGVLGVSAIYPWLSVQEGSLLEPKNPYTELFSVSNGGYWPVENLSADCIADALDTNQNRFEDNHVNYTNFARSLFHGQNATLPCFRVFGGPFVMVNANLKIIVSYSFWPLSWSSVRRHQDFCFQGAKDSTGLLHWTFVGCPSN